jgi:hypothetical protein
MGRVAVFVLTTALSSAVWAQNLRYDNHREVAVPEYATIQFGPFHSSWATLLTVGYRHVETSGAGTDFLFSGSRGRLKKDGDDLPIIFGLDTRNYLVIGPHTDLDVSVSFRYEYYPLDTQEDAFRVFLPGEGINANLSMEFAPALYFRMRVWDAFAWSTDYIDTRGLDDRNGGRRFQSIVNRFGIDGDILLARRQNLGFGAARHDTWPQDDGWEEQEIVAHLAYALYEYQVAEYATMGVRAGLGHTDYAATNRASSLFTDYKAMLATRLTEQSTLDIFGGYAIGTIEGSANEAEETSTVIYGAGMRTELSPTLNHGLVYTHGMREGYNASFDEFDQLRYDIHWTGDFWSWSAYTGLMTSDPSATNVTGYTDWTSGLTGEIPLLPYLSLLTSALYSERSNDAGDDPAADPELRGDYNTLALRVGTELRLDEEWNLTASVEHIERDGDDDALDYTRDIYSIFLTYRHEL